VLILICLLVRSKIPAVQTGPPPASCRQPTSQHPQIIQAVATTA